MEAGVLKQLELALTDIKAADVLHYVVTSIRSGGTPLAVAPFPTEKAAHTSTGVAPLGGGP